MADNPAAIGPVPVGDAVGTDAALEATAQEQKDQSFARIEKENALKNDIQWMTLWKQYAPQFAV